MKTPFSLRFAGIFALLFFGSAWQSLKAATHTWTGGGGNALWSNNANWSGGKPASNEGGGTIVTFGSGTTTTCDIAGLIVNHIRFTGGNNTVNGTGALTVNGAVLTPAIQSSTGSNTLSSSLSIVYSTGTCYLEVTAGSLTIAGNTSGSVNVRKTGAGTLTITGNGSYTGTTFINEGTLSLNSNGLNTAIPGTVVVGDGTGAGGSAVLIQQQNSEIDDDTQVIVLADGRFNLNNTIETIGSLSMLGGSVTTGTTGTGQLQVSGATDMAPGVISIGTGKVRLFGTLSMTGGVITGSDGGVLTLGGDVTASATANDSAFITANVNLNGTRTFTVNAGGQQPALSMYGVIADGTTPTGLRKAGTGTLLVASASGNSFTGATTVDKGRLHMNSSTGPLVRGSLTIGNDTDGPGAAVVQKLSDGGVHSTSDVVIKGSGILEMNDYGDVVGSLSGTGGLSLTGSASRLTVTGLSTTTFFGSITGSGKLIRDGTGSLTLKGTIWPATAVQAAGGTLILNFSTDSASVTKVQAGDGLGGAGSAVLRLATNDLLASLAFVNVLRDGLLDVNNTITDAGTVVMDGGTVSIGAGNLTVNANLTMTGGALTATGAGSMSMGGNVIATSGSTGAALISSTVTLNTETTFTVNPGASQPELNLSGLIRNNPGENLGFRKDGTGTMRMGGNVSNTFAGPMEVLQGVLELNNSIGYAIQSQLFIGNNVDAPNSVIVRDLTSQNISSTATVTINASGVLDLNGFGETCGGLFGTGKVLLKDSDDFLVIGGGGFSSAFNGKFSGAGGLHKIGNETLTLTGNSTHTGNTFVSGGTLIINGTQHDSAVRVLTVGKLGGTGAVGAIFENKGTISPGGSAAPGDLLVSGDANLPTGKLMIRLNNSATPRNDRLKVSQSLNITGTSLLLRFTGPVTPNTPYVIASYGEFGGTLLGTFEMPDGCSVNYAYNDGTSSRNIALTITNLYAAWVSSYGLAAATDGLPAVDFDKDTVPNAIEFVLGTDPKVPNNPADLPSVSMSGANVLFTFRRTDNSLYASPVVETTTNAAAGPWTTVSSGIVVTDDFYGAGIDRVVVTIPRSGRPRLFCRLKAAIP